MQRKSIRNESKERPPLRLLLVSAPGPICDATCITLAAMDGLKLVAIASGALTATRLVRQFEPDVVLVDSNLAENEAIALVQWMAAREEDVGCLVATATSAQVNDVLADGATVAVRREDLPATLHQLVEEQADNALGSHDTERL